MSKEPELGQMMFGNPTGSFGTEEWVDAFVDYILEEIGRIFWNRNQKEWDRYEDPQFPGLIFRSYWWGADDAPEAAMPNLKFESDPQEIRWYKHPGRGQSCSLEYTPEQWIKWFQIGLETIRKMEPEI